MGESEMTKPPSYPYISTFSIKHIINNVIDTILSLLIVFMNLLAKKIIFINLDIKFMFTYGVTNSSIK